MISKNYDLQTFKTKASQTSDFLKSKGYDVPKTTLLHSLAVFLGEKNWNTLKSSLEDKKEIVQSDDVVKIITDIEKDLNNKNSNNEEEYTFIDFQYTLSDIHLISEELGIYVSDKNELKFCIEHLNYFSNAIKNYNNDITLKNFLFNHSVFPDDIIMSYSHLISEGDYKNPYLNYINYKINNFELIGDEFLLRNTFIFNECKENHFDFFFVSLAIILFSKLNIAKPNLFQKNMFLKFRQRENKIKLSIFSFYDNSEGLHPGDSYKSYGNKKISHGISLSSTSIHLSDKEDINDLTESE